eukprot:m.23518 g.23518  ORF g.23518 m.23518 type:complete len:67 (-) comp14234_c0_seq1:1941-2141(-)
MYRMFLTQRWKENARRAVVDAVGHRLKNVTMTVVEKRDRAMLETHTSDQTPATKRLMSHASQIFCS